MVTNSSDKSYLSKVIFGNGSSYHDPAICILSDEFIFAEGLERHTQCKRAVTSSLSYSNRAILKAFSDQRVFTDKDTKVTCINSWDPTKVSTEVLDAENFPITASLMTITHAMAPLVNVQMSGVLSRSAFKARTLKAKDLDKKNIAHHLAHAANAALTSPFEDCVVMIIDGHSECDSSTFFHFKEGKFRPLHEPNSKRGEADPIKHYLASPGITYAEVTLLCGFEPEKGEEWKVMGLAAYGSYRPDIYEFFIEHSSIDGLELRFNIFDQGARKRLSQLVGGFRSADDADVLKSADLAHNFQLAFERRLIEVTTKLGALGLSKNLAFAGGCALNSSANGKLLNGTGFSRLHVPSAPADDGNALGAALYEKYIIQKAKRVPKVFTPYLGSFPNFEALERILSLGGAKYIRAKDDADLCDKVSDFLCQGKIIGWMQGRAEYGPRALGNRSIIGDPRPSHMKDLINERVKFREEYRPLAPSILHEFGEEYFESYAESPYMERALVFKEAVRNKVPAVVHKDGTGRLQTVKEEWNPLYYKLILKFYEKTGIPLILNTSFNVMGKPIIHSVEDAITVFSTSGLDVLVMGDFIITK